MIIIQKAIHIIDYDNYQVLSREIPESFESYVTDLITYITDNGSVREYKTRSIETEVIGSIRALCSELSNVAVVSAKMEGISKRLLVKETEAQEQIVRTRTNVQKGSLVQALVSDDYGGNYIYLLAKVEHSEWVDDSDFSFRTGFSKDKKILWKSCLIDLPNLEATEFHARIYSNTVAKYWSDGFLELVEMNNDEFNTTRAFKAIEATLNQQFRGTPSPDHTVIRNSFIGYFRNTEHIDYPTMVSAVLENYQPINPEFMTTAKITKIHTILLEQPQKKNFDSQFTPVSSAINARIRKVYPIIDGIDLKINSNINDLSSTIQSVEEHGVKYIRVRTTNDDTFRKFQTAL